MNIRTLNLRKKVASEWVSPLMYAMKLGLPKIVSALLEKGVEWDEPHSRKIKALFECIENNQQDDALHLIASMDKTTINCLAYYRGNVNLTAIMHAYQHSQMRVVRALLEKGVDWIERLSPEIKSLFKCIESNQQDEALHLIASMDETTIGYDEGDVNVFALMYAVQYSEMRVVRALIEKGANTDIRHLLEMKALFQCIENNQQDDALDLIASMDVSTLNLILDYGRALRRKENVTVLFKAVQKSQIEVVRALLAKGVDVNIGEVVFGGMRDTHWIDETPLYYTIKSGHIALMDMLLENGADIQVNPEEKCFVGMSGKTYEYHEQNNPYVCAIWKYNIRAFQAALRKGGYTFNRILLYSSLSTEFGCKLEKHTCLCYAVEHFYAPNIYQCIQQIIQRGGVLCSGSSYNTARNVDIVGAKGICSNLFRCLELMFGRGNTIAGFFCTYPETAHSLLSMIFATDYMHENSCLYKTLETYTDTIEPKPITCMYDERNRKRVAHTLEERQQVSARMSNITKQPSKLTHICRVYIRRSIPGLCPEVVETLPLPTKLIDYVNVVDKCEIVESCLK